MSTKKDKELVERLGEYQIYRIREISEETGAVILTSHLVTKGGKEILYCGTFGEAIRKIEADKRER